MHWTWFYCLTSRHPRWLARKDKLILSKPLVRYGKLWSALGLYRLVRLVAAAKFMESLHHRAKVARGINAWQCIKATANQLRVATSVAKLEKRAKSGSEDCDIARCQQNPNAKMAGSSKRFNRA
jgi:hypothetical protein